MALFPRWSNSLFGWLVGGGAATVTAVLVMAWLYVRSPLNTGVREPLEEPVMFDHRHHVGDDGIDCRYCHYLVGRSQHAGVPPTALCMSCHGQIWSDAVMLQPIRASYFSGTPIVWRRANVLPDYVYFNHAVHVNRGVGCVSCHGRIDLMAAVQKAESFTMSWCLDCHREPEPHLRPQHAITAMSWERTDPSEGARIRSAAHIVPPTTCSGCHR